MRREKERAGEDGKKEGKRESERNKERGREKERKRGREKEREREREGERKREREGEREGGRWTRDVEERRSLEPLLHHFKESRKFDGLLQILLCMTSKNILPTPSSTSPTPTFTLTPPPLSCLMLWLEHVKELASTQLGPVLLGKAHADLKLTELRKEMI